MKEEHIYDLGIALIYVYECGMDQKYMHFDIKK
jgi:hypothetical protein